MCHKKAKFPKPVQWQSKQNICFWRHFFLPFIGFSQEYLGLKLSIIQSFKVLEKDQRLVLYKKTPRSRTATWFVNIDAFWDTLLLSYHVYIVNWNWRIFVERVDMSSTKQTVAKQRTKCKWDFQLLKKLHSYLHLIRNTYRSFEITLIYIY